MVSLRVMIFFTFNLLCMPFFSYGDFEFQQNPLTDINCDGKRDVVVEEYDRSNGFAVQTGRSFKYADFDTNFDGNRDIIINFGIPLGCLKRDLDFDGKFDIEEALVHKDPDGVESFNDTGVFDTWYVVEDCKNACKQVENNTKRSILNHPIIMGLFPKKLPPEIARSLPKAKNLQDYLSEAYGIAERNYLSKIKKAIEKGADANERNSDGETLLMQILRSGYPEIAVFLISKGADVNAKDNAGLTVLMHAVQKGFPEAAKTLLKNTGCEIKKDVPETISLLISKGADVNAKSKDGSTVLMQAIKRGYLEISKLLIEKGADVNARDNNGLTVFMCAVKKADPEIVNLLLAKGVDAKKNNGMPDLDIK